MTFNEWKGSDRVTVIAYTSTDARKLVCRDEEVWTGKSIKKGEKISEIASELLVSEFVDEETGETYMVAHRSGGTVQETF